MASFLRVQVNWNVALSQQVKDALSPQMQQWLGLTLLPDLPGASRSRQVSRASRMPSERARQENEPRTERFPAMALTRTRGISLPLCRSAPSERDAVNSSPRARTQRGARTRGHAGPLRTAARAMAPRGCSCAGVDLLNMKSIVNKKVVHQIT